jgi:2-polyprenyl-3-methyl-5-hydroxy-6-metoxy-1,4-benzoquinol methylase
MPNINNILVDNKCVICNEFDVALIYPESKIKVQAIKNYQISDHSRGKHFSIFCCKNCSTVFQKIPISQEGIENLYELQPLDKTYLNEELGRRKSFLKILKRIEKIKGKGKILDFGAASGIFLSEARNQDWDICGIEISKLSIEEARERFNLNLIHGGLEKLESLPSKTFDVITAFDVVEHLIDPAKFVNEANRLLKNDGLLIITTPDFNSLARRILGHNWYAILPLHLVYFSQKSISYLASKTNFTIMDKYYYCRHFSISYLIYSLIKLVCGKDVIIKPLKKIIFPIQLFDELEVYLKKN